MTAKPLKATVTKIIRTCPALCLSQCGEMVLVIGELMDSEYLGFDSVMHPDEVVVQVSLENLEKSLERLKAEKLNVRN